MSHRDRRTGVSCVVFVRAPSRQCGRKRHAWARVASGVERTAVGRHNAAANPQSETETVAFCRVEGFEQGFKCAFSESDALIAYLDDRGALVRERLNLHATVRRIAFGDGIERINQKIEDDLLNLDAIAPDGHHAWIKVDID